MKYIIKLLISKSVKNRVKHLDCLPNISLQQFVSEFCTVNVNCGRRTGKTTSIYELAGKDDVIVISHARLMDTMPDTKATVLVEFAAGKTGKRFNTIYIDEPTLFSDLGKAISNLVKDKNQTLVIVGGHRI